FYTFVFLLLLRPPPRSTPFPYTTLFRSVAACPFKSSAAKVRPIISVQSLGQAGDRPGRFDAPLSQPRGLVVNRMEQAQADGNARDRKSTRLNSSHLGISYAVFCLKKKKT